VLTDFERYGEWNPFVVACRSSLVPGEPIAMRVHVLRTFAQSQTETILEHEPGRGFSYGLADPPLGAVGSRRSHRVTPLGEGRTHYESHFELHGWLAPLVIGLLGRSLRRGFGEMAAALAARAESFAGRSGSATRSAAPDPRSEAAGGSQSGE
jgi:hypothetical protein